jgi:AcrR family transcriptional regulator
MDAGRGGRVRAAERVGTRDEIQRVAADLFFAKGYEATTVREIAQELEIKSASIYYHFPDKEQILFEVVQDVLDRSLVGISVAVEGEAAPERRLAVLVVHHVTLNALRAREVTLAETELRSLTGDRRRHVLEQRDAHEALLLGVLEEGRRSGAFKLLDAKLTAYAVISMCLNVGAWFRADGRLALETIAGAYANLALRLAGSPELQAAALDDLTRSATSFYAT